MFNIGRWRVRMGGALIFFLWAHMMAMPFLAIGAANDWVMPTEMALIVALVAHASFVLDNGGRASRLVSAMGMMGMMAIAGFALRGHPLRVDIEFYDFIGLMLLAAYCDWRVIAAMTVIVGLHHLALDLSSGGGHLWLHEAMALSEGIVLSLATWRGEQAARAHVARYRARLAAAAEATQRWELYLAQVRESLAPKIKKTVKHFADLAAAAGEIRASAAALSKTNDPVAQANLQVSMAITTEQVNGMAAAAEKLSASIHKMSNHLPGSIGARRTVTGEGGEDVGTFIDLGIQLSEIVRKIKAPAPQGGQSISLPGRILQGRTNNGDAATQRVLDESGNLTRELEELREEVEAFIAGVGAGPRPERSPRSLPRLKTAGARG